MILDRFPEVRSLSSEEKLLLISELWNDLEENPSKVPVSREIIAELDRRMEHFRNHPNDFIKWEAGKTLQKHIDARAGSWDGTISGAELLKKTRPQLPRRKRTPL